MTCPQCEKLRAALQAFVRWLQDYGQGDAAAMKAVRMVEDVLYSAAASPLQSVITWIPVSERLPEDELAVFVSGAFRTSSRPRIQIGWYCPADNKWYGSVPHPTHWAELPPPPASEEETR